MNLEGRLAGSLIDRLHPFRILAVDTNRRVADILKAQLGPHTLVERATTADTALQMLAINNFNLVVVHLNLQLFSGIELVHRIKKIKPELPLLTVTAPSDRQGIEELVALGYPKPLILPDEVGKLIGSCRDQMRTEDWMRRIAAAKSELMKRFGCNDILCASNVMVSVYEKLAKLRRSRVPVLITGPSGTGKELVARMIHRMSDRARKPFLTVNCAAVPEGLLESQFFGHERGAFTGAVSRAIGKFEHANNGTLFLDEIGEMSPNLQAKLLRVIEYGEFERVGGSETIKVDVRLITATHRRLLDMLDNGTFRSDLYYRISVFPIELPPLNQRGDDLIMLAYHFLAISSRRNNRQVGAISPKALELIKKYPWPGNVRELENAIERALLLTNEPALTAEDFPHLVQRCIQVTDEIESSDGIKPLKEVERAAIVNALKLCAGNISIAARKLGIGRNTLYRKLEEQSIAECEWSEA